MDDHEAYPGASSLCVRLTGDRATGRLLGGQLLKFISARPWKGGPGRGRAVRRRFEVDATGTWLPLVHGVGRLTAAKASPTRPTC
ncbi:hypothetical protein [Nocardioides gansuensis]|uniref:hypothetical protein n=1 Tax=Nocardioides gansuensis TaxID=2138300 RepID=UPI001057A2AE|nr:hypothetical protein [Nocardioides gansuensis]